MHWLKKRLTTLSPLLLTSACTSVDVLNVLSGLSSYHAQKNINYGNGSRQQLDIYYPKHMISQIEKENVLTIKNSRPVIIFLYGGSWNRGQRKDYAFIGHALASKGFITIIPDYRLYPEARYPDFLQDNAAAVTWVVKNLEQQGGDTKNIFIMGHSAGAYNAAMLALDKRWLAQYNLNTNIFKGWIGISGPYDFYPVQNPDVRPVFFHPNYPEKSQPMEFINNKSIASFLATSPQDDLIDEQRNTIAMAKKLQREGTINTLKVYDTVDHISIIASIAWPLRFKSPLLSDIEKFIIEQST